QVAILEMPRPQVEAERRWLFHRRFSNWHDFAFRCACFGHEIGPDTYSGVDGKFSQDLITTYLSFGRPFEVNAVNPLEGVFSQLYPLNIWLNPGLVQFLIFDHDTALVASTAIFLFIYCLSIYALARTVDSSNGAAVVGAPLGVFVFPPLYHFSRLFSNYDLVPGAAPTVAVLQLPPCVVLRRP